jgi:hypothetical protein
VPGEGALINSQQLTFRVSGFAERLGDFPSTEIEDLFITFDMESGLDREPSSTRTQYSIEGLLLWGHRFWNA